MTNIQYHTINEIKELINEEREIINIWQENTWIIVQLDDGIRIKFLNF